MGKNRVRKEAYEYEFNQLMEIKQEHTYSKLEMQNYLTLFRYRTRMANYGEKCCGLKDPIQCGLTLRKCLLRIGPC